MTVAEASTTAAANLVPVAHDVGHVGYQTMMGPTPAAIGQMWQLWAAALIEQLAASQTSTPMPYLAAAQPKILLAPHHGHHCDLIETTTSAREVAGRLRFPAVRLYEDLVASPALVHAYQHQFTAAARAYSAVVQDVAQAYRLSTHLAVRPSYAWTAAGPTGYNLEERLGQSPPPEPLERVEWLRKFLQASRDQALKVAGIAPATYYSWAKNPRVVIRPSTVERLGRVVATIRVLTEDVGEERARDLLSAGSPSLIDELGTNDQAFERALDAILQLGRPVLTAPIRRMKNRSDVVAAMDALDHQAEAHPDDSPLRSATPLGEPE